MKSGMIMAISGLSIIRPKTPEGSGWVNMGRVEEKYSLGYECYCWVHNESGITVFSAVEVAKDDNDIDKGPEFHISISKMNYRRCSRNEARWVLKQFSMEDSKEDNHVPGGIVRNYWLPVAEKFIGIECKCVEHEPEIKEDKGDFIWRGITK